MVETSYTTVVILTMIVSVGSSVIKNYIRGVVNAVF